MKETFFRPLLPFRLRGMLLANVFLAVPLAAVAYSVRLEGVSRVNAVLAAAAVVPSLWLGMTPILIRPGPARDALGKLSMLAMMPICLVFALGMWHIAFDNRGGWYIRTLAAIFAVFAFAACPTTIIQTATVRRCPACGRRGLLESVSGLGGGLANLGTKCFTLHVWCLSCGRRFRRPRRTFGRQEPWLDASDPDQDGYYWLWTPADLFHSHDPARIRSPTPSPDQSGSSARPSSGAPTGSPRK